MWHINVAYKIAPYQGFNRFFPMSVIPLDNGPWDPSNTPNPYLKGIITYTTLQPLTHSNDSLVYQCKLSLAAQAVPLMFT